MKFEHNDILTLQRFRRNGIAIPSLDVIELERIWKTINPDFKICKTCKTTIRAQGSALIKLVETTIGMNILDYPEYELPEELSNEQVIDGMTAQEMLDFAEDRFGYALDIPKKNKKKIKAAVLELLKD